MIITKQISRLAKEYDIDFSLSKKELAKSDEDEVMQNMPINRLLDIKDELSADTILDGFYLYAKKHINDKSRIPQLTYSLLLLVETNIDQVKSQINENKKAYKQRSAINKDDSRLGILNDAISNLESYHWLLINTQAFFRMEVDNLKNNNPGSQKTTRETQPKSFVGLNWKGARKSELVNELYKSLKGQYIDPKTRYKDFEKLFDGKSVDESFTTINWIHEGGATSLRYLFHLQIKEHELLTCTRINKLLSLAFTRDGDKINVNTLKSYSPRIKDGRIPDSYIVLKEKISIILQ